MSNIYRDFLLKAKKLTHLSCESAFLCKNPPSLTTIPLTKGGQGFYYFSFLIAAWAAANLATGTLYGEQDT